MRRLSRRSALLLALAGLAGLLAVAHSLPVALWHLRFEPQLAASRPERLHSEERRLAEPLPNWTQLSVANLRVRAPIAASERARCAECADQCVLALRGGGTLAILGDLHEEPYGDLILRLVPDADEVSLLQSYERNWQMIDALADQVRFSGTLPPAHRFASEASRGVVTTFEAPGLYRSVAYAYSPEGAPTRILGVTGVSRETVDRILGGLEITGGPHDAPGTCDAPARSLD